MKPQSIERLFHFCPQCGSENSDVGSIPFRCEHCGFSQFFGPVAAVGALVADRESKLLLVRRARDPGKGRWGLPGGFVDRDETIEDALSREVLEETNLRITGSRYLMSYPNAYNYRGIVAPVIDFFFCCQVDLTEPVSLDRDELEHHEWVHPTDAYLDRMAFDSNRIAIEHWLSQG